VAAWKAAHPRPDNNQVSIAPWIHPGMLIAWDWRAHSAVCILAGSGGGDCGAALQDADGSSSDEVTITPAAVVAGSPELIRVNAPAGATVEGEWLDRKLEFFRGRDGQAWYALAGVDVESPGRAFDLRISARTEANAPIDLSRTVEIHPAHLPDKHFDRVAPKFV